MVVTSIDERRPLYVATYEGSGERCCQISGRSVRFLEGNAELNFGVALLSGLPGSPGSVALSGRDYRAIGALFYSGGIEASGGSIGCVLATAFRKLCSAIVTDFVMTFAKIAPQ